MKIVDIAVKSLSLQLSELSKSIGGGQQRGGGYRRKGV